MPSTAYLHLIPVSLGDANIGLWLPSSVQAKAQSIDTYIAENAKTARAFLKQISHLKPIQDITIHTLDKRGTTPQQIREWLSSIQDGGEIGLVSEAGCPAVADPGAAVVAIAHELNIHVMPHVGPSSILLSLMGSGLDGQQFAFHGYPPVKAHERDKTLKEWELHSKKHRQTQIFIETPYRNDAIFAALLQTLNKNTKLCIARSLTTPEQWLRTRRIEQWLSEPHPELAKQPSIFLFQA